MRGVDRRFVTENTFVLLYIVTFFLSYWYTMAAESGTRKKVISSFFSSRWVRNIREGVVEWVLVCISIQVYRRIKKNLLQIKLYIYDNTRRVYKPPTNMCVAKSFFFYNTTRFSAWSYWKNQFWILIKIDHVFRALKYFSMSNFHDILSIYKLIIIIPI